ncbi:hypothetical protein NQ318_001076 [Aromia moschata]|uniref:Protein KRI1 homolog n=1 Tax=Aromia moschata TaxID=1265417 RepID=A0AAV8ZFH9_9CUCU|nr:hypothetical protein NQ318_001076 [Aromia moschata]
MSNLFEADSDSDVAIKTDNEYAKKYDTWRKKEELNKLKTKYGEDVDLDEDSSSSSDDDEDGVELTAQVEKEFFKTLACLKNKDSRIYDGNTKFFDESKNVKTISKKEKKKERSIYLKDYERNIILEKGGVLSDDENSEEKVPMSPTYVEEQKAIKENLKKALNVIEEEEGEEEWGGLFRERNITKEEKEKEEVDYKKWLLGQENEIEDKEVQSELKPLKDYWNNPNLDEGEKFLRDYILNKKFLDKDDEDYIPTYDELIHDSDEDLSNDEENIEKQEEFEYKFNFRFEEPDQEFIKRYPRTMENSVRRKDDRRSLKRQETKERKKKEKEEKLKDLKKLQELKRKEIEEKLNKLKEITGNKDIGFADEDIDGEFDPEEFDSACKLCLMMNFMKEQRVTKNQNFQTWMKNWKLVRPCSIFKNWDRYGDEPHENNPENEPHCEDDNFNMDCDYDPKTMVQKDLLESSRGKKKRKRKSKFAEAVNKPKPKYDPNDKNYEEYFEEYYKLDCEDIIGDIPCRFKYRKVAPNDFGLTTEEILLAKERELNRWCSLKKALQIRPDNIEKYDQIAYKKKAQNINLKRKNYSKLI